MNDNGMIAPYLTASLVIPFKLDNTIQFSLIKDPNSIRTSYFLIFKSIPVTLCSNMLTFGDNDKAFKIYRNLLKTITNYKFLVTHSNPQDQKLFYEFGKEKNFDINRIGRKSYRNKYISKLLKSSAIVASGVSTIFLQQNPNELCDRIKTINKRRTYW